MVYTVDIVYTVDMWTRGLRGLKWLLYIYCHIVRTLKVMMMMMMLFIMIIFHVDTGVGGGSKSVTKGGVTDAASARF